MRLTASSPSSLPMYLVYSLLLTLVFLVLLPRFLFDAIRHGKYVAGFRQRMGRLPSVQSTGQPVIWLHCVSVGETQAARPLVESLRKHYPNHSLVVSTITLTGQTLAKELFKQSATQVIYFPFDWGFTVRRALRQINPSLVLLMETELWPNFLRRCSREGVPVVVVNGRISERSLRRYRLVRPFIAKVLSSLDRAIMQSEGDANRIRKLGLRKENTFVSGSLKFDAGALPITQGLTRELAEQFGATDGPILLAASTHAPEERILLEALQLLRQTSTPLLRLMIAPRHPERFNEVASLMKSSGYSWTRRTGRVDKQDHDLILLDTIGELTAAYPLAEIVFVGGSISHNGGHNILEPAAIGACIVTGAHTNNFRSIVDTFVAGRAVVQLPPLTESEAGGELAAVIAALLEDHSKRAALGKAAMALVRENLGATEKTIQLLLPFLTAAETSPKPDLSYINQQVHSA